MELQWNAEENAGVRRHVQQSVVQRSTKLIQEVKSKKLKEKLEEKKKKQHLRTGEKTQETWEAKCRNNRWHKKSHPSDKRAPGTVPEKEEKTLPLFQEEEPSCFLLHLSSPPFSPITSLCPPLPLHPISFFFTLTPQLVQAVDCPFLSLVLLEFFFPV